MKTPQTTSPQGTIWRAKHLLALALTCSVAACGGGTGDVGGANTAPVVVPPPPVQTVHAGTWVVMGSSTAAGAGAPAGKGWVDLLQAAMAGRGAQIANIAIGGTVTYHGMSTTAPAVAGRPLPNPAANIDQALARKPVLLIVSYPTNDTALGYSSDETVNNILAIRSLASAAGVPVLVTSTQPRNLTAAQLAQLRVIDQRLAASIGPCFVDVGSVLAAADGRLAAGFDSGDGVHPGEAGHRLISTKVQQTLDGGQCVRVQ